MHSSVSRYASSSLLCHISQGFPTIKLLGDDGLVYEYNGGRTTDEMVQFANGGYKTGTGTDYPDPAKAPPPEPEQTTEEPEGSKVVVLNSMVRDEYEYDDV